MFINLSNHPSSQWSESQKSAALVLTTDNEILDLPFPNVPAYADTFHIATLANEVLSTLHQMCQERKIETVMVQGEFTLTYRIVRLLQIENDDLASYDLPTMYIVAACSERKTVEQEVPWRTIKTAVFEFVQFREYI